jgi:hypothetical protein
LWVYIKHFTPRSKENKEHKGSLQFSKVQMVGKDAQRVIDERNATPMKINNELMLVTK